jgi:tetratricopeptide (TPR) repeat protein|tara:strand:- start:7149 stop:8732 length:1584 start_codon:yes stop_codon:yes gene_type:complete
MLKQLLILLVMTLGLYPLAGTATPLARIELNLPGVDEETQNLHAQMLILNAERRREEAITAAEKIIERVKAGGGDPTVPMLNLSLLQAATGDLSKGLDTLDQTISMLDAGGDELNISLIRPLKIKGLLHWLAGQFEDSESALRRAQHLLHRSDGVYSSKQHDILNQLTVLGLQQREFDDAIREQTYAYLISTLEYGADSLKLLPHTYSYAAFLCDLGHFKDSIKLLEDVVQQLSETYGEDDVRLIKPLRSIANVRLLQREVERYEIALADVNPETKWIRDALGRPFFLRSKSRERNRGTPEAITTGINHAHILDAPPAPRGVQLPASPDSRSILVDSSTPHTNSVGIVDKRSYRSKDLQSFMRSGVKSLRRVVDILDKDPASDATDKINALVALGDMHMVSGSSKAFTIYRQAWQQILESPNPAKLQSELFGSAIRIQPKSIFPLPVEGRPSDSKYAIETQHSVSAAGQITNIKILHTGIPANKIRELKRRLYLFRYRPRMENGEFVATDNLALTQEYYRASRQTTR